MYKIKNPTTFRSNVCKELNQFVDDEVDSINLERGIFNFAIKESTKNKIIKKWENPLFAQIYRDRLYSIFTNLKKEELQQKKNSKEVTPQQIGRAHV